jgi:hypothetical protein
LDCSPSNTCCNGSMNWSNSMSSIEFMTSVAEIVFLFPFKARLFALKEKYFHVLIDWLVFNANINNTWRPASVVRPLTFHILIYSSETTGPNGTKLGRKHLYKVLYKVSS